MLNHDKQPTRKLGLENLEERDLLSVTFSPMPTIQYDQVLVSQQDTLDDVQFTMNSVLNTLGDRENSHTYDFSISKNISLASNYPSVNNYFQEKNYTSFSNNYEVTLDDRKLLFIQADKRGKHNTTREIYTYDTKTKELLNIYSWSDLMMLSKFDNILDCSFNSNSANPVSCEIVNNHVVVSVELANSSGRLSKDNIYGVKALKRFELADQNADTNNSTETFFVNKNLSVQNYSDIKQYLRTNNYTAVSDSYEIALNDRRLVFFQASQKDGDTTEVFSYDTKTRELLTIKSWSKSKVLTNIGNDTIATYSFNMEQGVSCRVIDNHALVQVGIIGKSNKTKTEYVTTVSRSYNLLNPNTQPSTNPGTTPSNPATPDNYTLPTISNISLIKSYPEIEEYLQNKNFQSISNAYEISLSDRKILFIQANRKIGKNSFSEVFAYDTKTAKISSIDSWAELINRNQYIETYNCSIDTSSEAPITCEIDGKYAVVTVRLNFNSDKSGNSKFQAFKRYEIQETGINNSTLKYDKYFVNRVQLIQDYPDITRYLQRKNYNNISNSYEVALDDRKFVFVEASKQASKEIFVYDTKTKELLNVESWAWAYNKLRAMDSSISSISFDTSYEEPVKCTIIDNTAIVSVYYKGKSDKAEKPAMISRSFRLGEQNTATQSLNTPAYGPMPKEYYMNN